MPNCFSRPHQLPLEASWIFWRKHRQRSNDQRPLTHDAQMNRAPHPGQKGHEMDVDLPSGPLDEPVGREGGVDASSCWGQQEVVVQRE